VWDETRLELGFRSDLIGERMGLVEIKSVEAIAPVHKKQVVTHLQLLDVRLGLLINFNVELIRDGISRIVNRLEE
jgi:GxxExxY protein